MLRKADLQMGCFAVFLQCQKENNEVKLSRCESRILRINQQSNTTMFRHHTYHNESLVLDAFVPLGISQAFQNVEALLDGLQGGLEVAQFLVQRPQHPALLLCHALQSRLLLLVQSLSDH